MSDKQIPSTLRELIDESQRTIEDLKAGRISQKEAKLRGKEIDERIKTSGLHWPVERIET